MTIVIILVLEQFSCMEKYLKIRSKRFFRCSEDKARVLKKPCDIAQLFSIEFLMPRGNFQSGTVGMDTGVVATRRLERII